MKKIIMQNTKAPIIDTQEYHPNEGHIDLRTPEQKQLDLEAKVNDLTKKVLEMHALTEQLRDTIHHQGAVLKANGLADSSMKGDH